MNENKGKDQSPLVQSVCSLDDHFSNLERLGQKIDEMKLNSESDMQQVSRLMLHFSEHGEGIAKDIAELSHQLQDARLRAEAVAQIVATKAAELQKRKDTEQMKMQSLRDLTDKVNLLNQSFREIRSPAGAEISEEDRQLMIGKVAELERQLQPLVKEAQILRTEAHELKLKALEQQASSLTQTLINASEKLAAVTASAPRPTTH